MLLGRIYVTAGDDKNRVFGDMWHLDVATLEWTRCSPSGEFEPRTAQASAVVDGFLYVFGGADSNKYFNDLLRFDFTDLSWGLVATTGDIPSARVYSRMVSLRNKLYVYGGTDSGHEEQQLDDVYCLDLSMYKYEMINNADMC